MERNLIRRRLDRATRIPVKASSGNVFADLGLPDAEEELTKAQLASLICQIMGRRRLTQTAAASAMGIGPRASWCSRDRVDRRAFGRRKDERAGGSRSQKTVTTG